jgi:soluble lytic murein transglycosylase-like protein
MRAIRRHSSDSGSSCRLSNHPSRPDLKAATRSSRPQQQSHSQTCAWPVACLRSLRATARIVAAVTPLVSPIAPLPFFEGVACAQNASRREPADRFAEFITEASDQFAVPARWIRAVMQIESGGDEHATSPRGAMGLMQIMLGTWAELNARYGIGNDPFDSRANILAGAAYLKEMHDRFGPNGFLAAYHAGPSRYQQHLATGQPLPPDTLAYVAAVTPLLGNERGEHAAAVVRHALPWREAPLFVVRAGAL